LQDAANRAGFAQYEVANFARRGLEENQLPDHAYTPRLACQHNVNYWRGGSFYGLGPSATGYLDGVRWKNCANTVRYCESLESGVAGLDFREELPPTSRAGETAAFGLRMVRGWEFEEFQGITGEELDAGWTEEINTLCTCGWGERTSKGFRLTRAGLRFADTAAEMFLRPTSG